MTATTPTTLLVVRREPEVFEAKSVLPLFANNLPCTNVRNNLRETVWSGYTDEYHKAFTTPERAADLAHNRTIESLIADCQFNVDACESLGETNFGVMWEGRVTWLKQQLRPIAEVGEDV